MTRACRHDRLIQLRVRPSLAQHQVHPRGQLPGHRHLEKAVFSIHCDFSDVGSSTVYISLENLNRITSWYVMTYCKPCLHSAARGAVRLLTLDLVDIPRIRELMNKYADRPMDLADAALVRVAEREGIRRIFTVDRSDFTVYRLHGRIGLEILP